MLFILFNILLTLRPWQKLPIRIIVLFPQRTETAFKVELPNILGEKNESKEIETRGKFVVGKMEVLSVL